jgi:outer membrane protein OmpA-like peptidoglycan-associated protein
MTELDTAGRSKRSGGESYYVSITDLLLGLIFVFLILLTYFAAQFQNVTQDLISADAARGELLRRVQADMAERGYVAEIDEAKGSLSIAGEVLFESGEREPTPEGRDVIKSLANALYLHLPCFSSGLPIDPEANCARNFHSVETVLIEGHTDSDQISGNSWMRDNLDLSAARAASTFNGLLADQPLLDQLRSGEQRDATSQPIFSIAGYADRRPLSDQADDASKSRNRRIELRIIMAPPKPPAATPSVTEVDWPRIGSLKPLRMGQRLHFRRGEPSDAYLGTGWARPERDRVWTQAREAELILPLENPVPGASVRIRVMGIAFVPEEDPVRTVNVRLNEEVVATWEFSHPQNVFERDLILSAEQLAQGGVVRLTFEVMNPASPGTLGLSSDFRELGISLHSLRVWSM